jgi:hypothetical protein
MPQPVKLSDQLIEAAREAAPSAHRSLAAQIEHWAALGRAIDSSLTPPQSADMKYSIREPAAPAHKQQTLNAAVIQALAHALSPEAQLEFADELASISQPRYSADAAFPGCIIRENSDGTRTPGHWSDGGFVPLADGENHEVVLPSPSIHARRRSRL